MANTENKSKNYYTIDLLRVVKMLWKKAWIIVLTGVLCAASGLLLARFIIAPTYSSTVKLYVNNSSISVGNFNISASELTAAQGLVKTYGVILDNKTTLDRVIEKADVDYTYEELSDMLRYGAENNTEVMFVTVTSKDPYEAAKIADCIEDVLVERITDIIDGAKMTTVQEAFADTTKVGPSITKYTAVGFLLGALVSMLIVAIIAIADDRIHDEDYILDNYNYPILAKIPDLVENDSKKYGYYYRSKNKTENDVDSMAQK